MRMRVSEGGRGRREEFWRVGGVISVNDDFEVGDDASKGMGLNESVV